MKLNKKILAVVILSGLAISTNSLAETASAQDLANTCAGCHGTDGNSVGPATPTLAGISAEYFTESMEEFKSAEDRASTIMSRIAKGYNDAEIALMADYFSQQKMHRREQQFDKKMAKAGAKLHRKYCEKCHEDGGRSSEDDSGILSGQWMQYLQFTMEDFTSGQREMTKKMKKKVRKLEKDKGPEALTQLIHFYGSQK